jgi:hypothetical protein
MKVVLKVQRPLAAYNVSLREAPYLAYDEKRRIIRELPETWQLRELFKMDEAKVYVEAEIIGNAISLGKRVRPQPW